MRKLASACFILCMLTLGLGKAAHADPETDLVKNVTIQTPHDMGYFAGDLVIVDVTLTLARGAAIDAASLPHPGPITYWLDLKTLDIEEHNAGQDRRVTLKMVYQDFYDALDARPMEIPTFAVRVTAGSETVTADVPAWTIGVSPLREVAPPVKDDPKDYMEPDQPAPFVKMGHLWLETVVSGAATLLALTYLAFDRAWWPFHVRPARVFGGAVYRLRKLRPRRDTEDAYLEALRIVHRGIDQTDRRRVMADDLPAFLGRHAIYRPLEDRLQDFFFASRQAFFASEAARSQKDFPFDAVEAFARRLAEAERAAP